MTCYQLQSIETLKAFRARYDGGFEQPDLMKDAPAHSRGVGVDVYGPLQLKPFYDGNVAG